MRELFLIKCSSYFQSDILKRSQGTFLLFKSTTIDIYLSPSKGNFTLLLVFTFLQAFL